MTVRIPRAPARRSTLALFPQRVPEPDEPQSEGENAAYSAWIDSPVIRAVYAGLAAHILARTRPRSGGRLLCVADGEGTLGRALGARWPDGRVLSTDVSPDMVARAAARPRPSNVDVAVASAYDLSAVAPAELVVCAFSFHHLREPGVALRELVGAVAPGGWLYVVDLRRDSDLAAYQDSLRDHAGDERMRRLTLQSTRASHTTAELRALAAAAPGGTAEVGLVDWGGAEEAAFRAALAAPDPALEAVRTRVAGTWVEALVRRP